jgi:hypothetical protein
MMGIELLLFGLAWHVLTASHFFAQDQSRSSIARDVRA